MRRLIPRTRPSEEGFTLLEVVVAMAIALIAVMGLMTSVAAGSALREQTRHYGEANRAIQELHERYRGGGIDDLFDGHVATPTFQRGNLNVTVGFPEQLLIDLLGGPVPAGWRYVDEDADGEVDRNAASTTSASLLPVRVTVSWQHGGQITTSFIVTEK